MHVEANEITRFLFAQQPNLSGYTLSYFFISFLFSFHDFYFLSFALLFSAIVRTNVE